ncbi:DUF1616 domain-containing protein [Candidatus Woesearchaeota archaeon]|nr:DUF1616 domain-containing protein [Candidatus Woesearchaeota archaeon]
MKKNHKTILKIVLIILSTLFILSLVILFFSKLDLISSFRIVFGSVYVLFLPGFLISYLFFPKTSELEKKGSIDWIERIALSFALSIAVVPLFIFYLNLLGLKITALNSVIVVLIIILLSLGIIFRKKKLEKVLASSLKY